VRTKQLNGINGNRINTMGCVDSKPSQPVPEPVKPPSKSTKKEKNNDLAIEEKLMEDRRFDAEKIKLLLLGAGESGKSTIFKQMRILYGSPKTDEDLKMYGVVVRSNIVVAIRKLCKLLRQLGLEHKLDEESKAATMADLDDVSGMTPRQAYDQILMYLVDNTATESYPGTIAPNDWVGKSARAGLQINNDAKQFLQHVEAIRVVWQCRVMKDVWMKRAQANVNDSHKDYLQDLTRIASPDYRPTEHDIIICRIRTTQITMERYMMKNVNFEVYDVGGQRSERRKWIDCFEGVDAVVFVAALSEYDQILAESKRVNRMMEALDLFESVAKNRAFQDTSIMLFLNKKDIFMEKVEYSDISAVSYFSDYDGAPKSFDEGVLYFIQKFQDRLVNDELNEAFIHVTCATNTTNMEFVLDSLRTIMMAENIRESCFFGSD